MKQILTIAFIFISASIFGQTILPKTGAPNGLSTIAGGFGIDSMGQVAPKRDTLPWMGRKSDFIRRPDGKLWAYDGSKYVSIGASANLSNTDLTQTGNRTYDGAGHSLAMQNFAGLSIQSNSSALLRGGYSAILAGHNLVSLNCEDCYDFYLNNGDGNTAYLNTSLLTLDQIFRFQNKSGTLALLENIAGDTSVTPTMTAVSSNFLYSIVGTDKAGYVEFTNTGISVLNFSATIQYTSPYSVKSFPVLTSNFTGFVPYVAAADANTFTLRMSSCPIGTTFRVYYHTNGY